MKDELEKKNEEINELKILLKANVKKLEELTEKMFKLEKTVMKLNIGNQSHVNEMESCEPKISSRNSLEKHKVIDENGYPACHSWDFVPECCQHKHYPGRSGRNVPPDLSQCCRHVCSRIT